MYLHINVSDQELVNFLYKRVDNKYFRVFGPHSLLKLLNSAICSRKVATDNTYMNYYDCLPIKILFTKTGSWHSLPNSEIY